MADHTLADQMRPTISIRSASILNTLVGRAMALLAVLTLPVLLMSGCNSAPSVSDADLVYIDHIRLQEEIRKQPADSIAIVDPRSARKFEQEHLPGAINIPLQYAKENDPLLQKKHEIIIYGSDFDDPLAISMSKKLLYLRYDRVLTFRGGLTEWRAAGLPTVPAPPVPPVSSAPAPPIQPGAQP